MQWIFNHTDEYQKMRDLNPELPHVDYKIAQQYRALLDMLVYVGRSAEFDSSDGSDEFDEEHKWAIMDTSWIFPELHECSVYRLIRLIHNKDQEPIGGRNLGRRPRKLSFDYLA